FSQVLLGLWDVNKENHNTEVNPGKFYSIFKDAVNRRPYIRPTSLEPEPKFTKVRIDEQASAMWKRHLERDNSKIMCERCNRRTESTKRLTIQRFPQVIVMRPVLYDLYAVCNHSGTVNMGHYTACMSLGLREEGGIERQKDRIEGNGMGESREGMTSVGVLLASSARNTCVDFSSDRQRCCYHWTHTTTTKT
ncbi:unnamed protein product, partial [Coregonus sp. 'balchen']